MQTVRSKSPHLVEDGVTFNLNNPSNWSLTGYSRAGERTSFKLNELNVLLDCGLALQKPVDQIFMTHSHIDHCWGLPNYFDLKSGQSKSVRVHFPEQTKEALTKLMQVACLLSYPNKTFTDKEVWEQNALSPQPIVAGDILKFKNYNVEVLPAVHTTTSVGYGFSTKKTKLKQDYIGRSQKDLIDLKNKGFKISEEIITPEFAFFCDSTIHNLRDYEAWKKYPSVIVESTGFSETHTVEQVRHRGHTHFDEIVPFMLEHKTKNWFLIHTSLKCDEGTFPEKEKLLQEQGVNLKIIY